MNSVDYVAESGATDKRDYSDIQERMSQEFNAKMTHYMLGLGTEAGELQDELKKVLIYGKEWDLPNVIEELGDLAWYSARILDLLGVSYEEVFFKNNAKLKARYGDKFTEYKALNRNLDKEREILEK